MNILLVRPKPNKKTINLQSFMLCEPLELEYLATIAKQKGANVDIVDMIIEKKSLKYFLSQKNYDIVGFTAYLPHVNIVKCYAEQVKKYKSEILTVVGGVVAQVNPELFDCQYIDIVVKDNPLANFAEIIDSVISGKNISLHSKQGNSIEVPNILPDREITNKYRHKYNYIFHDECAVIKTSYGCQYSCDFCYCNVLEKGKYAERKIDDVIQELETIKEQKVFIVDDNFLYDVDRLSIFCSKLDSHNIHKEFICFGRADFISENQAILDTLKQHGLKAVFVGLESFRDEELNNMNKRTTVNGNIQAVKVLESLVIDCYCGIIVGYDWERKDFDNLIKYLNSFEHPMVNIQPITPMKGTQLYSMMKSDISQDEQKYELWDMAHLVCKPSKISTRKFYYNIIRAYMKTSANKKSRQYVKSKYGIEIYKRVKRGVRKIFWQYVRLCIKG